MSLALFYLFPSSTEESSSFIQHGSRWWKIWSQLLSFHGSTTWWAIMTSTFLISFRFYFLLSSCFFFAFPSFLCFLCIHPPSLSVSFLLFFSPIPLLWAPNHRCVLYSLIRVMRHVFVKENRHIFVVLSWACCSIWREIDPHFSNCWTWWKASMFN